MQSHQPGDINSSSPALGRPSSHLTCGYSSSLEPLQVPALCSLSPPQCCRRAGTSALTAVSPSSWALLPSSPTL